MLTPDWIWLSSSRKGSAMICRSLSASTPASVGSPMSAINKANSSPPNRARVSVALTVACNRSATDWSSRSPIGCPSVSLTSLK